MITFMYIVKRVKDVFCNTYHISQSHTLFCFVNALVITIIIYSYNWSPIRTITKIQTSKHTQPPPIYIYIYIYTYIYALTYILIMSSGHPSACELHQRDIGKPADASPKWNITQREPRGVHNFWYALYHHVPVYLTLSTTRTYMSMGWMVHNWLPCLPWLRNSRWGTNCCTNSVSISVHK